MTGKSTDCGISATLTITAGPIHAPTAPTWNLFLSIKGVPPHRGRKAKVRRRNPGENCRLDLGHLKGSKLRANLRPHPQIGLVEIVMRRRNNQQLSHSARHPNDQSRPFGAFSTEIYLVYPKQFSQIEMQNAKFLLHFALAIIPRIGTETTSHETLHARPIRMLDHSCG